MTQQRPNLNLKRDNNSHNKFLQSSRSIILLGMNNFYRQILGAAMLTIFLGSCSDMGEPEILLPQLGLDVNQVDFSAITIGNSQTQQIAVYNTGAGELQGTLTLVQDSLVYALHPEGAFTLAAGDTLFATLSFLPGSETHYTATILITSDDPGQQEVSIQVLGSGTAALIPVLSLSRTSIDFGSIFNGETSQEQVTFTSTGTDTVRITNLQLDLDVFVSNAVLPLTLAPGETQLVTITYQPSSSADHSGSMVITSNSSGSPQTISLAGKAEAEISYAASVQPIFNSSCIGCHGTSGGLNLSSYSQLMSGGNTGGVVITDDGVNSRLVKKLRGTAGSQMPLNGSALSEATINIIENWINQGALDN